MVTACSLGVHAPSGATAPISGATAPISGAHAPALFAGVDVSRDHLDLFVTGTKKTRRFANDEPGIAALIESISRSSLAAVAVESTGGYERRLLHSLLVAPLTAAAERSR